MKAARRNYLAAQALWQQISSEREWFGCMPLSAFTEEQLKRDLAEYNELVQALRAVCKMAGATGFVKPDKVMMKQFKEYFAEEDNE